MADHSKKRKQQSDAGPGEKRPRFPQRPQHQIHTQPTKTAFPNGEVNVKNFLKSHENEIKSLEHAMRAAKKGQSRRAFQDVPRELRRRTASHNPQRVPKRLRARSKQEAKEDNTPISRGTSGSGVGKGGKGHLRKEGREKSKQKGKARTRLSKPSRDEQEVDKMDIDGGAESAGPTVKAPVLRSEPKKKPRFPALATPATPPSRFRKRQKDKTWLPTHIWHAKRARMTDPKDPLWRFSMPLQPVMKAFRLTHRAATQRGAVAWDMSYMSTIGLEGAETSIIGMLKGLHYASEGLEDPWQDRGRAKKWRHGTRVWEGWIYEREAKPLKKITPIIVVWCMPEADSKKRKVFIRVHPSAFLQLWNEVIRISKVQKPVVAVEDLRFEVGSIEIMGPAAVEALCSILLPTPSANAASDTPQSVWPALASVTDVGSLPAGALLAFDISDPRFRDPPAATQLRRDEQSLNTLMETLAQWPVDASQESSSIFDRNLRLAAQRAMPSQKSINRRKSTSTLGVDPEANPTDPQIPMLMFTSRENKSWTILLPWKCVQPVWRGIMRYPVSTGGNPRFGGVKERRQVNFERSVAQFPFDHPGTDAGWKWELREREVRKHEWTKRPKGKRIEWSTIDLGNGNKGELGDPWACNWERLLPKSNAKVEGAPRETEGAHSSLLQLATKPATDLITGVSYNTDHLSTPCLFTVKITMTQRGVPTDCARIYRLPTNNEELRNTWLSLIPQPGTKRQPEKQHNKLASDAPEHIKRRALARSLLEPHVPNSHAPTAGEDNYPTVPGENDLIGFVTTGNFNLAEGMPTAVANLALHRVLENSLGGQGVPKKDRVCIVRPAGGTIGRLATWEVV
jgi:ribonuclease P/MRP protein subunit POP1